MGVESLLQFVPQFEEWMDSVSVVLFLSFFLFDSLCDQRMEQRGASILVIGYFVFFFFCACCSCMTSLSRSGIVLGVKFM